MLGLSKFLYKVGLAVISCNLPFLFGYSFSDMDKKSTSKLRYNMESSGQLSHFIVFMKMTSLTFEVVVNIRPAVKQLQSCDFADC